MTDSISSTNSLSSILSDIDLGPTGSVQFAFAKLQLAQSQLCKNQAENYMKQIEKIQDEQKQVAEMIAEARKLQNSLKDKDAKSIASPKLVAWMKERGLDISGKALPSEGPWCGEDWAARTWQNIIDPNGHLERNDKGQVRWVASDERRGAKELNKDEWTYTLQSLTNYQESIGNKTQTLMVYLQDFISQYNSYLQGASSQISTATQTLTNIARGS